MLVGRCNGGGVKYEYEYEHEREREELGAIHLSFDSLYESWYCFARVLGS